MKKIICKAVLLAAALAAAVSAGACAKKGGDDITVISREESSGTRSAFTELTGIADDGGDHTTLSAEISQSTAVVITSVEGNENAIGYISLGSLSSNVKAVSVDGAAASVENINNGTYKLSRPFNIATREDISPLARDFVSFILSDDGQKIIEEEGYIAIEGTGTYKKEGTKEGKITLAGSTSVSPVMMALKDAYVSIYPDVKIEIEQSGSSAGMESAISGACDIGMASREVKDSEKAKGLIETRIAMDGIAVIVNNANEVNNLTVEQIKSIFTGDITAWSELR